MVLSMLILNNIDYWVFIQFSMRIKIINFNLILKAAWNLFIFERYHSVKQWQWFFLIKTHILNDIEWITILLYILKESVYCFWIQRNIGRLQSFLNRLSFTVLVNKTYFCVTWRVFEDVKGKKERKRGWRKFRIVCGTCKSYQLLW